MCCALKPLRAVHANFLRVLTISIALLRLYERPLALLSHTEEHTHHNYTLEPAKAIQPTEEQVKQVVLARKCWRFVDKYGQVTSHD